MTGIEQIEAVILSYMRPFPIVERGLATLGLSRDEATTLATELGLQPHERAIHWSTDRVLQILGAPALEEPMPGYEDAPWWSKAWYYPLPLWSGLLFQIRVDRDPPWGGSSPSRFVRRGPQPSLLDPSQAEPWKWTFPELQKCATSVIITDQWSVDKDAVFTFDSSDGPLSFAGRFDFELLQEWSVA